MKQLALIFVLFTFTLSAAARSQDDPVGKVILTTGALTAVDKTGVSRDLARGAEIYMGDILITDTGKAQIRFFDEALITLEPATELKVAQYYYQIEGRPNYSELNLLKGGLRMITGLITEPKPDAHKVITPVVVMSVRGTTYDMQMVEKELGVSLISGLHELLLKNVFGEATLSMAGKRHAVTRENQAPEALDELPARFKRDMPCDKRPE